MEDGRASIILSMALTLFVAIFFIGTSVESKSNKLVITEIAAYENSDCEWVEIYNKSDSDINIKNYNFYENSTDHRINTSSINNSFKIKPKEYAVIAKNSANIINTIETSTNKCKSSYKNSDIKLFDSSWGSLKESGEEIGLKNNEDSFTEKFTYITSDESSLERKNLQKEDYTKQNWGQSTKNHHTFGKQNSNYVKPKPPNKFPLAKINASITTTLGKTTNISAASSTDPDGDIKSHKWKINSTTDQGITTTFQFQQTGTSSIKLIITDDRGATDTAKHTLEILPPEQSTSTKESKNHTTTNKLKAGITAPSTSTVNNKVLLDGSNSTSSPDLITHYYWRVANTNTVIATSTQVTTTLNFSETGTHKISLKITNENNKSDTVTQDIKILEKQTNSTSTPSTSPKESTETSTQKTTSSSKKQEFANTSSVKINEVLPNPTQGNEWIELYNISDNPAKTSGWKLFDGANKIKTLQENISSTEFETVNLSSSKLNNSGDIIVLKHNDKVIDQVTYGDWDDESVADNAKKPDEGSSIARSVDGDDSDHDKNDFKVTINPTKGGQNEIQSPESNQNNTEENTRDGPDNTVYTNNNGGQDVNPSDIVINELVSNPREDNAEFIELYNNTNESISLNDWWIEDESETQTHLSGNIPANQFYTIEKPDGQLNNSGDIIKLFSKDKEKIDQIEYKDNKIPQEGESLARKIDGKDSNNINLDFKITTEITKDSANIITEPTNNKTESTQSTNEDNSKSKKEQGAKDSETKGSKDTTNINVDIKIIELLPSPLGKDKKNEYITIKNFSNQKVSLTGWELSDQADNKHIFKHETLDAKQKLKLDRSKTKIALNNGQEAVRLIDPKENMVDTIRYEAAKTGKIYKLSNDKWTWYENTKRGTEKNISETKNNTKTNKPEDNEEKQNKKESSTTTKKEDNNFVGGYLQLDNATNLEITEILPNPKGSDNNEFIELYNPTNKIIELGGLKIDDEKEGSSAHTIKDNTKIKPKNYFILAKKNTGIALNNTSDKARVMYPDKSLISSISYKNAQEGKSFDGESWSSIITPGYENKIKKTIKEDNKNTKTKNNKKAEIKKSNINQRPEYLKTTLENIPDFKEEQKVQVRGLVAVKPGILGSRYFYIVGSPGLQIYNHNQEFPKLSIGDRIEVKGELSKAYGEWRLKTDDKFDIRKIDHPGKPKPQNFDIAQIEENYEGGLASIQGEITEMKGSYFYVDDGTEEIKTYIKQNTGIDDEKFSTGDLVKTTGIVSERSGEYRILPRKPEDIKKTGKINKEEQKTETSKGYIYKDEEKIEKYLIATAGAIIVILFTLLMKEKSKTK